VKQVLWDQRAAELGQAKAQYTLGGFHECGEGVRKDPGKAAHWYRKAAELEDVEVQYHLGICYAEGHGVHKDAQKAAEWWRAAAELGAGACGRAVPPRHVLLERGGRA
jgi:TPR repeat protein